MPTPPLPWFKVWIGATSHGKVRQLNDALFRTWVELLDAAAQQPVRGRFKSAREAALIVRRPLAHIKLLITPAGLIDETPDGLAMHDWDPWQRWRKEDANNTGSTHDHPPDQRTNNTPSTHDERTNNTAPLRIDGEEEEDVERDGDVKTKYPPNPPRGKRAKPAHEVLTQAERTDLIVKWQDEYGGMANVADEIDSALNHNARLKCKSERLYVDNWLRRGLEMRPARRNGHAATYESPTTPIAAVTGRSFQAIPGRPVSKGDAA